MAKMFYSIDEAAARLKKSAAQVKEMVASGQLQEFRDRDRLMFKREQVDLLAGDAGDSRLGGSGVIPLADSRGGSGMELSLEDSGPVRGGGKSGSGPGIEVDEPASGGVNQRSGISIFDADNTDESDPLAATAITDATRASPALQMEQVGSGSGLLDLTREADDTSLGADLLEDVYKPEEGGDTGGASGLFESTAAPSDMSAREGAPAMAMVMAEPYDGMWSGISGGLAIGAALACIVGLFAVLSGILDAGHDGFVRIFTGNVLMWVGILAAVVIVPAIIGMVMGKK